VPGSLVGICEIAEHGWRHTVRAGELSAPFPTVGLDVPAVQAAQLLAGQNLPGLIVVDDVGRPWTVLPGTQVLRMAVPAYCQEDAALARVIRLDASEVAKDVEWPRWHSSPAYS
jgi:hypothetical protein